MRCIVCFPGWWTDDVVLGRDFILSKKSKVTVKTTSKQINSKYESTVEPY